MKKMSFVTALIVSAALAAGCHKNKPADKPSGGSDMGGSASTAAGVRSTLLYGGFVLRRAKQTTIIVTSASLVAGVLSMTGPAQAAVTAATGIPITIENSGKCLNVANASTANSAKVVQYTCVASATNDKWVVVPKGNDLYWIQNVGSGKCLTVQNASTANNAPLIQYTCTTGANETWYIESQYERPTMRLISAGSGRCLDVPGNATANNVQLIQYTCQAGDGTANERVIMPPTTSAAVVHRPFTSKQPVAAIQGGVPAAGGTAPVAYNWIGSDRRCREVDVVLGWL
jgi:hypothetical protein